MAESFVLLFSLYLALGLFAGLMSGLLGIGGGSVIVPGLLWIFSRYEQFSPANQMHLAIGTSLAVIVVTALRGLLAYQHHKIECFSIYKQLAPGIFIGVIAGAWVGDALHSQVLTVIFAGFLTLVALKLLVNRQQVMQNHRLPGVVGMTSMGLLIGGKSGLLGIGGGALTVPFMLHYGVDMRRSIVLAMGVTLTVSVVGTITLMFTGMNEPGLPARAIGYVYWPAWLGVVLGSTVFVPLGVNLSTRLPVTSLRRLFAIFLLVVAAHMFWIVF